MTIDDHIHEPKYTYRMGANNEYLIGHCKTCKTEYIVSTDKEIPIQRITNPISTYIKILFKKK